MASRDYEIWPLNLKSRGIRLTHGFEIKSHGLTSLSAHGLDAHLYTGLPLQPKGRLLKKEAAGGKVNLKAGKLHRFLSSYGASNYISIEYLSSYFLILY